MSITDRPLAALGLTSYRCKNRYGWTMIGAKNDADALAEACRSDADATVQGLEVFKNGTYVPALSAEAQAIAQIWAEAGDRAANTRFQQVSQALTLAESSALRDAVAAIRSIPQVPRA